MPDPFQGSGSASGYSVDKFYTASRNKKGFGSTVRVTVSPEMVAEIGKLVASRQIPEYATSADFYRDCLVHRLKYLQGKLADGTEFKASRLAEMLMAIEEQDRITSEREARQRLIRQIKDNYNNAEDEAERRAIRARIEKLYDESHDRILKEELGKFLR